MSSSSLREKIDSLNPWFYEIDLGEEVVTPGIYNDDSPDNRGPERLVYRQKCRKTLLVDQIASRYNFSGKKLLDVACNCGFWSSMYIKDHGAASLIGIEGREVYVNQADLLYSCRGIRDKADFRIGNVVEYDYDQFEDSAFDFVLCSGILYHIKNQSELLSKLARINKEVMVVDTRVAPKEEAVLETKELHFNAIEETRDKTIPGRKDLIQTMESLGYSVEVLKPEFKIGKGLDTVDNYHNGSRVCLFCKRS